MKYIYLYSLLVIAAGIAGCTPKTGSHSPSLITEINWEEMTEERKPLPQPLPLVCDIAEMTTYDSMILLKSDKTAPAFNILKEKYRIWHLWQGAGRVIAECTDDA